METCLMIKQLLEDWRKNDKTPVENRQLKIYRSKKALNNIIKFIK